MRGSTASARVPSPRLAIVAAVAAAMLMTAYLTATLLHSLVAANATASRSDNFAATGVGLSADADVARLAYPLHPLPRRLGPGFDHSATPHYRIEIRPRRRLHTATQYKPSAETTCDLPSLLAIARGDWKNPSSPPLPPLTR